MIREFSLWAWLAYRTPTRWTEDEARFCEITQMLQYDTLVIYLLHHTHSMKVCIYRWCWRRETEKKKETYSSTFVSEESYRMSATWSAAHVAIVDMVINGIFNIHLNGDSLWGGGGLWGSSESLKVRIFILFFFVFSTFQRFSNFRTVLSLSL